MKKSFSAKFSFAILVLFVLTAVSVNAEPQNGFLKLSVLLNKSEINAAALQPAGLAVDGNDVIFTDISKNAVYSYSNNEITLFAGLPSDGQGGYVDAITNMAKFSAPRGILALDSKIYVSDSNNDSIRIITGNIVSTYSGGLKKGWRDGDKRSALYNNPTSICADLDGNMFISDTGNNCIRKITLQGEVSTIAGISTVAGYEDGKAETALFNTPLDIEVYDNAIYVADSENKAIRIIKDGEVTTLVADKSQNKKAKINSLDFDIGSISCLAISKEGVIYFSDNSNNTIYKIEDNKMSVFINKDTLINMGIVKAESFVKQPSSMIINSDNLLILDDTTGYVVQIELSKKE